MRNSTTTTHNTKLTAESSIEKQIRIIDRCIAVVCHVSCFVMSQSRSVRRQRNWFLCLCLRVSPYSERSVVGLEEIN